MNTVRKHLSLVKGGYLAQKAHHLRLHSYLLSDVPNDQAEVIGSGPTVTDSSTYSDALQVLSDFKISQNLPNTVLNYLYQGAQSLHPETPKPGLNDHPDQNIHLITGSSSMQPFLSSLLEQQGFGVNWASEPIQASVKKETQRIAVEIISVLSGQSKISSKSPTGTQCTTGNPTRRLPAMEKGDATKNWPFFLHFPSKANIP